MGGCAWILCRSPIVAHHGVARDATVYTNAPIRRGEARSSHSCTLLRSQGHPQPKPAAQQCTQTPQSGAERPDPPICVHYCDPKVTHNPSPQPNSVHKCPKSARRGPIRPFVYTIVALKISHSPTVYTNVPIRRGEARSTHLCTLLRSLAPQESRQVSWSNMSSSSRTWSSSRRRARW